MYLFFFFFFVFDTFIAINYRLSPETRFPGALLDAVYAFLYLTDPDGLAIDPSNIAVMGDSAGGGLALAMMLYLRDHHMANVGCAVLFSVKYYFL